MTLMCICFKCENRTAKIKIEEIMAQNGCHNEAVLLEIEKMCQQKTSILPSTVCFFAGSSVELPELPLYHNQFAFGIDSNPDLAINCSHIDIDLMYYTTQFYALPIAKEVPETSVGEIRRICSSGLHPGFARIIGHVDGNESRMYESHINMTHLGVYSHSHGPALQTNLPDFFLSILNTYGLNFCIF